MANSAFNWIDVEVEVEAELGKCEQASIWSREAHAGARIYGPVGPEILVSKYF